MWPFNNLRARRRIQELERTLRRAQEYEVRILDALTYSQVIEGSDSNPYTTKLEAVKEIKRKYKNSADYGVELVKTIINYKTAQTLPYGVELVEASTLPEGVDPSAEMDWLQELIDANNLGQGRAQDLERQAQFEGQVLVRLAWDPAAQQVKLKYIPWADLEYEVVAGADDIGRADYEQVDRVEWLEEGGATKVLLDGADVAVVAFNNAADSFEGHPVLASVLREIEELDKALRDWHKISQLFA